MSAKYFIGGGFTAVPQVDTLTVGGTVEVGDKFAVTLEDEAGNTATVTTAAGSTSTATTATEIAAACNLSTDVRFSAITFLAVGSTVTLTADVAGVPFRCTVATVESNDASADAQAFVRAATTPNKGPEDAGTAENYSDGVVPVTGDHLQCDGRMRFAIKYGLKQTGVTLASLKLYRGRKAVGTSFGAYRISATKLDINLEPEDGSGSNLTRAFARLDTGANASTVDMWGDGLASDGVMGVTWKGAHASNVVNVHEGTIGIAAAAPGETATVAAVNVTGGGKSTAVKSKAIVGSGVTLTDASAEDGAELLVRCAATAITVTDERSKLTLEGSGAVGTIRCNGKGFLNGTGTITALHVEDAGVVSTRETNNARTVTTAYVYGGGALATDRNTTYTNPVQVTGGASSAQVDGGGNVGVEFSALI